MSENYTYRIVTRRTTVIAYDIKASDKNSAIKKLNNIKIKEPVMVEEMGESIKSVTRRS